MNQRSKIGPTLDEKQNWQMNASEYNYRYHKFCLDSQKNAKPPAAKLPNNADTFTHCDDITHTSSYMKDYAEKRRSLEPVKIKRTVGPSTLAPEPDSKMACISSYKTSFDKKNARPAPTIRPPPPQGLGWKDGKLRDLNSVNMVCYRPYTSDEVNMSKRKPIIISPEYGTIDTHEETRPQMYFQTTQGNDFVQHVGSFRPPPAPGAAKGPAHGIAGIAGADINAKMDLTTTHQQVFSKKNARVDNTKNLAVPPLLKDKSAKTPGWYRSIDGNHHQLSTQMQDYIVHKGVMRPKSFQPVQVYNQPSTRFNTDTLYKKAFTQHGNHRRAPMKPAIRTKEDEIIKHVFKSNDIYDTEYKRIYLEAPKAFIPPKPIVPKTTNRTTGRFYDETSYSQNFNADVDRSSARVPSFKPKKVSNPWYKSNDDSDKAHFRSTTREHYQGKFALPATICKPKIKKEAMQTKWGAIEREVHFDTEYGQCFRSNQIAQVA